MQSAKLTVKRINQNNKGSVSMEIYIDNKRAGYLKEGEEKTFEIIEGPHEIVSGMDWVKTKPLVFNIKSNESKEIESGFSPPFDPSSPDYKKRRLMRILFLLFSPVLIVFLTQYNINYWIWFPPLILLPILGDGLLSKNKTPGLFYLISGRHKYFYLKEV